MCESRRELSASERAHHYVDWQAFPSEVLLCVVWCVLSYVLRALHFRELPCLSYMLLSGACVSLQTSLAMRSRSGVGCMQVLQCGCSCPKAENFHRHLAHANPKCPAAESSHWPQAVQIKLKRLDALRPHGGTYGQDLNLTGLEKGLRCLRYHIAEQTTSCRGSIYDVGSRGGLLHSADTWSLGARQ